MSGLKFLSLALVLFALAGDAFAVTQLINIQGKVTDASGNLVNNGDLRVYVYNASAGGTPVFNSSGDFSSKINGGVFNVLAGSVTALDLDYGRQYWMDFEVNGKDLDWDGAERTQFASATGEITGQSIRTSNETAEFAGAAGQPAVINITRGSAMNAIFITSTSAFGTALNISAGSADPALQIVQTGYPSNGAIYVDNTGSSGPAFKAYSDKSGASTALVLLQADNSGFGQDVLKILDDGKNFALNVNGTLVVNVSAGRVGIGTTTPGHLLHIKSSADAKIYLDTGTFSRIVLQDTGSSKFELGYNLGGSDQDFGIYNHGDGAGWKLVLQNKTGNVGIGTTSPSQELDVVGDINATSYRFRGDASHVISEQFGGTGLNLMVDNSSEGRFDVRRVGDNALLFRAGANTWDTTLYAPANVARLTVKSDTGRVGINTTTPGEKLEVRDGQTGSQTGVARFDNSGTSGSPIILNLIYSADTTNNAYEYVRFLKSGSAELGSIEGSGAGGITFDTSGEDYAEWLESRDHNETYEEGDVVFVKGGNISKKGPGVPMIVSVAPAVRGNSVDETDHLGHDVAFVGQIRAKIRGTVKDGDYVLPSGLDDGTAIAKPKSAVGFEEFKERVIGVAWESSDDAGVKKINVAVGIK